MADEGRPSGPAASGTEGPEERLAALLLSGVEALRADRAGAAAEALQQVCDDPALAQALDLTDVRARAHSLLAQALLEEDRPEEAQRRLDVALRLAAQAGDSEALPVLAELGSQIRASVARQAAAAEHQAQAARLAALSVQEIEARVRTPEGLVEVLVRKANADADVGRTTDAAVVADRALVAAMTLGDPRLEVLARLSVARAAPERAPAELLRAHACADRASEPGLITAVAKAAALHGVALPTAPGGGSPL